MLAPINPQAEEMRAQRIVSSLTDHEQAADVFGPKRARVEMTESAANGNREYGQAIKRVFKAITNRRPVVDESVQQPTYSSQSATSSGC